MKLTQIIVSTTYDSPYKIKFNRETWSTSEMYFYQVRKIPTKSIYRLNVILHEKSETFHKHLNVNGVINVYKVFDFDEYFSEAIHLRKRKILDIIYDALVSIVNEEDLDIELLNQAYTYCLSKNLENRWIFNDRFYLSPDKKYYGAFEIVWEIDSFFIYGKLFDKEKKLLCSKLLLKTEPYNGDFIYWAKALWNNSSFVLKSKTGNEWEINTSCIQ